MTTKEKAKELVDKYMFCHVSPVYLISAKEHSKQCALLAADEIIKALHYADTAYDLLNEINYWQEVKQEIEKL